MDNLKNILVVIPQWRQASPALHRAMAYAHRTGATLHLYLFDYYAPIDHSSGIFGHEVADRARRDFLDERMRWLTQLAAGLSRQGIRVECDVIWAPEAPNSVIAKVLEVRADLVIKDVECERGGERRLRPEPLDWKLLRLCPAPLMLVHPESKVMPRSVLAAVDVNVAGEAGHLNDRVMNTARQIGSIGDCEPALLSVFSYTPIDTYASGFIADTYEIMSNAHRESLERFADKHHVRPGLVVRLCGFDVGQCIVDCARQRGADLVALGSAYKGLLGRLAFGTVAESAVRKLACDVLLVKPEHFETDLLRHLDLPVTASSEEFPAVTA